LRLKKRQDFLNTARLGRKWVTKSFVIQILDSPDLETSLIGFTATKKHIGNAVQRNRAKRRLRALCDHYLSLINKKPPHQIVLIAREESLTLPFEQMVKDFSWAWSRLFEEKKSD